MVPSEYGTGMAELEKEIAAFEKIRAELEAHHKGKWVVVRDAKLEDTFDNFERAAEYAVKRFGAGPYLIRQVGAPEATLPASVMYQLV
jgi:hypothetical protein